MCVCVCVCVCVLICLSVCLCVCVCVRVCVIQYKDNGDFEKSPWTWGYAGSEVDESKKLVGHYNQSSGLAVLVHGGMTIFFRYIGPQEWRETKSPTLKIECKGREFKALESFPETICGKKKRTLWDRVRGGRER